MLQISNKIVTEDSFPINFPEGSLQKKMFDILSSSSKIYSYHSIKELKFEFDFRVEITVAARELLKSRMSFKIFRKSTCNDAYWDRTDNGGFSLKAGVNSSDAIRDIFINGSKYGTECATAIVIIFYKAALNIFKDEPFNNLFKDIFLMNWDSSDEHMDTRYYRNVADPLPGDCRYFKNPEVNPKTPEWQGENTIDLGNGTYFGHGIGIDSAEKIINVLNRKRISEATESAYLLDSATRPDFKGLARLYNNIES